MANEHIQLASPGTMVMPDEEAEERLVIPTVDFTDLRAWVADMRHPVASWSNWAATFLGVSGGGLISWLVMPDKGTGAATGVLALWVGGFILAVFMAWVGWQMRKSLTSDRDRIVRRMERIEQTCPRIRRQADQIN